MSCRYVMFEQYDEGLIFFLLVIKIGIFPCCEMKLSFISFFGKGKLIDNVGNMSYKLCHVDTSCMNNMIKD